MESRLQDVFDNGAIYLLPSTYNCYGITYNKTLLKKYGWELPNSFAELEELAAKAKEAGVDLCLPQIQYPGYGFQYLCNIADAISSAHWTAGCGSGIICPVRRMSAIPPA